MHTFNTESGLIRKVDALGLSWQRLLGETEAGGAAGSACVAVLPFLLDREKLLG